MITTFPTQGTEVDGCQHFKTEEQDFYKDADGNLHGKYQRFYEDGTLQTTAYYNHGRREGVSEDFDEYGDLMESFLWSDHRIVKVLHDMPLEEANEMIGTEYFFAGR